MGWRSGRSGARLARFGPFGARTGPDTGTEWARTQPKKIHERFRATFDSETSVLGLSTSDALWVLIPLGWEALWTPHVGLECANVQNGASDHLGVHKAKERTRTQYRRGLGIEMPFVKEDACQNVASENVPIYKNMLPTAAPSILSASTLITTPPGSEVAQ